MIYIVTSGEYSDYSIERVFSTREKADAYAGTNTGYMVKEFEVDAVGVATAPWSFTIFVKKDGSKDWERSDWEPENDGVDTPPENIHDDINPYSKTASIRAYGATEEQARRRAYEIRDRYMQLIGAI